MANPEVLKRAHLAGAAVAFAGLNRWHPTVNKALVHKFASIVDAIGDNLAAKERAKGIIAQVAVRKAASMTQGR